MTTDGTALTGNAIEAVAALAEDAHTIQQLEIDGVTFTDRALVRVNADPALPKPLEFYTLKGLTDYLLSGESFDDSPVVHVVSPTRVDVVSRLTGADKHLRRHIAQANCKTVALKGFAFDQYFPMENLNIALQTCFQARTGDIEQLQQFCAAVRSTAEIGTADDGVSQSVTAKAGIAAVVTTGVKNPWRLAPFRTFSDIDQPQSPFVLRFKQGQEPTGGLFETGDASWQVSAVSEIASTLRRLLGGSWKVLG